MTAAPRRATWVSPAKVNLCLRVVGRRPDGYHLLDSIFVPVDLGERVIAAVEDVGPGRQLAITVATTMPGVPLDATNLAARAAASLLGERGLGGRVTLALEKRVPPGSGLGGGSGNAATVLSGLNALLGLGVTRARLAELALALGADVPFFLAGTPARVRGIGERVDPIAGWPGLRLVIAIPPFAVPTAHAFRAMAALPLAPGDEPAALAAGAAPAQPLMVNDLERAVVPRHPAIGALAGCMREAGASGAVMSGSGSAVVGVVPTAAVAAAVAAALGARHPECRVLVAEAAALRGGDGG